VSSSHNQRRAHVNEASDDLRKKGLSPKILDVKQVLLVRQLTKILERRKNNNRASDAAIAAQKVLDLSLRSNTPDEALACQRGCNHCCHNSFVSASAPHIFRIAEAVESSHGRTDYLERICTIEDKTRGIVRAERYAAQQPCTLLMDGACSVYEHRPTACRGFVSHDVSTCEIWVDGIHAPPAYEILRGLVDFSFAAALMICGMPFKGYELNHAVRVALEVPDAQQRWLGGEDIFQNVMKDDWKDDAGISSVDFLQALIAAAKGDAMDILNFPLL